MLKLCVNLMIADIASATLDVILFLNQLFFGLPITILVVYLIFWDQLNEVFNPFMPTVSPVVLIKLFVRRWTVLYVERQA